MLATGLLGGDGSGLPLLPNGPGLPLLGEHARGRLTRPHLRGQRAGGRDWSTRFACEAPSRTTTAGCASSSSDKAAGLALRHRGRVAARRRAAGPAHADQHRRRRLPPRGPRGGAAGRRPPASRCSTSPDATSASAARSGTTVTDGLWLRESRVGRPGLGGATMAVLGTPGFSTTYGEVLGVHVGLERQLGAPGRARPGHRHHPRRRRAAAARRGPARPGRDATRRRGCTSPLPTTGWTGWPPPARPPAHASPAHPARPAGRAQRLGGGLLRPRPRPAAPRSPTGPRRIGVERFVLDDGWFHGAARRHRRARRLAGRPGGVARGPDARWSTTCAGSAWSSGSGSSRRWSTPTPTSTASTPTGSCPPVTGCRCCTATSSCSTCPATRCASTSSRRSTRCSSAYPIDSVKWDHNRDLLEAGSTALAGAPAVHRQTLALLRAARRPPRARTRPSTGSRAPPAAAGSTSGVLERVQRFWTSDMTDALARQQIQRWTTQLVAPEYVGAHVSAPTSHTTGRTLPLDFRAATALFGSFGIEWDLTDASDGRPRPAGRLGRALPAATARCCTAGGWCGPSRPTRRCCCTAWSPPTGPRRWSRTCSSTSPRHNRGVFVRVPGLDPEASYDAGLGGAGRPAWASACPRRCRTAGPTDGVRRSRERRWRTPRVLGAAAQAGDRDAGAADPGRLSDAASVDALARHRRGAP